MFQIGTNWQLCDLGADFEEAVSQIKLRGYIHEEPLLLPAEFSHLRPLSVDDIASNFCPTHRDLFLLRKRKLRGSSTWGRIAGPLIEEFCKGITDEYQRLFDGKGKQSYDSLKELMQDYSARFMVDKQQVFDKLRSHATYPADDVARFILALQYAGRYELAMLGVDWLLTEATGATEPLLTRVPLEYRSVEISPNSRVIGISSPSRPDFLISSLKVVGDVKSGDAFKDFYTLTCAGYAIAYENEHGPGNDINFGIIYFLRTHSKVISTARSYAFVIDDELRKEFLDRRNESFGVLLQENPPQLADRQQNCRFCKYLSQCDKDS